MPLFVVSTPIGNPDDITWRAVRTLQEVDLIIGEEGKEVRGLLKRLQIPFQNLGAKIEGAKPIEFLNEHSTPEDIQRLGELCRTQRVALVSDCGTPGFCDPGAELVAFCHKHNVPVSAVPGASSLLTLLAVSGHRVDEFLFAGFLPANTELRQKRLRALEREPRSFVIMDTPYRFDKTIQDLAQYFPDRAAVIGINLTQTHEQVVRGKLKELAARGPWEKSEFIVLVI